MHRHEKKLLNACCATSVQLDAWT